MRWRLGLNRVPLFLALALCGLACRGPVAPGKGDDQPHPPTPSLKPTSTPASGSANGRLLAIGGGLDDDNKPVYERFVELTRAAAGGKAPRVVIATAASGDQDDADLGKRASILAYCPDCEFETIRRETPAADTLAAVDRAHALFFTGGDQKRITARYRPDGKDMPEAVAMRRLLERGGVIAGTSAGEAMMSDPMFLSGRSAPALGIAPSARRSRRADDASQPDTAGRPPAASRPDEDGDDDTAPILGPRIGPGMGFLPRIIVDSHFFERNRFGRLVAALETSQLRFGIGVGEDACVEYDLSKDVIIGLSVADALLVDVCQLTRDGLARRGIRTKIIAQGDRIPMENLLRSATLPPAPPMPTLIEDMRVAEPGQNRQLASWRFFIRAQAKSTKAAQRLKLDGYELLGWPDGAGGAVVEIRPLNRP